MEQQLLFISKASESLVSIEIGQVTYQVEFSRKTPGELKQSSQTAENTIYLIDVHFSYDNQKLQEQPGVDFYRNLLKMYESIPNGLDNLKVIFYSPLTQDYLVDNKPENYVLNVLPFIQFTADGTFKKKLEKLVTEHTQTNSWPIFNVASENLLSGWSLFKFEEEKKPWNHYKVIADYKIKIPKGKKHLFIDDEYNQWHQAYKIIFNDFESSAIYLEEDGELLTQKEFRNNWSFNRKKITEIAKNVNYITSDFYLTENHKDTKYFKDGEDIKDISGFGLMTEIYREQPWIPYTIFTSSNKIWNYEFFEANGCWNWCVKDYRVDDLSSEEKKQEYKFFKDNIESIYSNFWQDVQSVWCLWDSNLKPRHETIPNDQNILGKLVLDCLHRIRNEETKKTIRKHKRVVKNYFSNHVYASVCVSLAGFFDRYFNRLGQSNENNNLIEALYFVRSYFAHGTNYHKASEFDSFISLIIVIHHIIKGYPESIPEHQKQIAGTEFFTNQQVFFYYQIQKNIEFDNSPLECLLKSYLSEYIDEDKLKTLKEKLEVNISKCTKRVACSSDKREIEKIMLHKDRLVEFVNDLSYEIDY